MVTQFIAMVWTMYV